MKKYKICVIGLGYVGLPLANSLSKNFDVIGYDVNEDRINQLLNNFDKTGELDKEDLKDSSLLLTSKSEDIAGVEIYIITVPTPIDSDKRPDLSAVFNASTLVAKLMKKGSIVVYESTVYPGVTEEECGPLLEKVSGLRCGKDFWLGYSPERINPGDVSHTLSEITKVVAGQNENVLEILTEIYGSVNNGNVFKAKNIKTAEAAKVIENSQRDINIAFINEVAMIFDGLGLSTYDILEAANTKWNFLDFKPGLVGGHCIGVDPFYLAYKAQKIGVDPEIILAGRKINDKMGSFVASRVLEQLKPGDKVMILGFTFKENVPDIRNTKVIDIVSKLQESQINVEINDPRADSLEVKNEYNINLVPLDYSKKYNSIILAVRHQEYNILSLELLSQMLELGGCIYDLKGVFKGQKAPDRIKLISF